MMTRPSHTSRLPPALTRAPGWPEILVGAVVYLIGIAIVGVTLPTVDDAVTSGILALFASGMLGLLAFGAAFGIRIRSLAAFGLRRAPWSRVVTGAALGVGAYLLGVVAALAYITLSGDMQNVQAGYQAAAAGGWLSLALTFVTGAILTPLGEEAYFRGVLANGLFARWPAWIAIVASAAIFAIAHGINPVLPVAFVVGLATALLFRWTGSIWPGVALHAVNNGIAFVVPVIFSLEISGS